MATWQEIVDSVNSQGPHWIDLVRRQKIRALYDVTGRPVIVYAVDMFNSWKIQASGGDINISLLDKDGFFEALRGITWTNLDVILHSPGWSPDATESIVRLLRSRWFTNIRFIVPSIAKSAATMLAMSGDEIILWDDAELGPTDPQMNVNNGYSPAHAILDQFEKAKIELMTNTKAITAWIPILQQYGPSLLSQCSIAISLTEDLVKKWLTEYMFKDLPRKKSKANIVSKFLAGKKHLSHGRSIDIDQLKVRHVKIFRASECSPVLSEIIQDISYSLTLTFLMTGTFKMFENHLEKWLFKVLNPVLTTNQT